MNLCTEVWRMFYTSLCEVASLSPGARLYSAVWMPLASYRVAWIVASPAAANNAAINTPESLLIGNSLWLHTGGTKIFIDHRFWAESAVSESNGITASPRIRATKGLGLRKLCALELSCLARAQRGWDASKVTQLLSRHSIPIGHPVPIVLAITGIGSNMSVSKPKIP